jgi:hypothetical protein
MCRRCNKEYNDINKIRIKEYNKTRYEKDKEKILDKIKKYHVLNKSKIDNYTKEWYINNKNKIYDNQKKRYKDDINYRIKVTLRNYINLYLKHKDYKKYSSLSLLGCTIDFFKKYLENQFLPEMSWDNHGIIWEIDHIKPCSIFDLTYIQQQQECFHYTNLQPLFKTTKIAESFGYKNIIGNRNKGNKI